MQLQIIFNFICFNKINQVRINLKKKKNNDLEKNYDKLYNCDHAMIYFRYILC